jgi:hypothetical protein
VAQTFEVPFVLGVNPVVEPVSRSNAATRSSSACVVPAVRLTVAAIVLDAA